MSDQTNRPPPAPRQLTRRMDRKMIAGVAAGLGDYFALDPILIRLAFVVLALAGGAGVLLYIVAWVLMPAAAPSARPPGWLDPTRSDRGGGRSLRGVPAWVGAGLLLLGALLLVSHAAAFANGAVIWGVLLIAVGVLLWWQDTERSRAAQIQPVGEAAAAGPTDPIAEATLTLPAARWAPPAARRRSSQLGWLTLGSAVLAVGVAELLRRSGFVDVSSRELFAIPFTAFGLGLLAGAWVGRARWLVVPAILLAPFMLAASLLTVPLQGPSGARGFAPTSVAAVAPTYRMSVGQLAVDLTGLPRSHAAGTVTASIGIGRLAVYVPRGRPVHVDAGVDAGQVVVFGVPYPGGGLDQRVDRTFEPAGSERVGSGVLDLNLRAGFGLIQVIGGPPPAHIHVGPFPPPVVPSPPPIP